MKAGRKPNLLAGGRDAKFRQLFYDVASLSHYVDAIRRTFAQRLGILPAHYTILMMVLEYQTNGGVPAATVASHLHVPAAFVAAEARKLEKLGLLEKRPNPHDRRSSLLALTAGAQGRVAALAPHIRDINDRVFASLSESEFSRLARNIETLLTDAQQMADAVVIENFGLRQPIANTHRRPQSRAERTTS